MLYYIYIPSRLFVVFMCVLSVAWLPLVRGSQGGQLFSYLNMIQTNLVSPVGIAFILAMFWKRTTEQV